MAQWKGDKAVLAANRALAAEATLVEMAWRAGLARKRPAVTQAIRARTFAKLSSRAAVDADTLATKAEIGEYKAARYFRNIANDAEGHAAWAFRAAIKIEPIKETV